MVIQGQRFSCTHPLKDASTTSKRKPYKKSKKNVPPELLSDAESEYRPENANPELGQILYGSAE